MSHACMMTRRLPTLMANGREIERMCTYRFNGILSERIMLSETCVLNLLKKM
jgi:hypothetical protein